MPAQTPATQFTETLDYKRRSKIDYSKYKTKICRHYQLGSCPFEDRCAFSHGDDASPAMSLEGSPQRAHYVGKSDSTMLSDENDSLSDSNSDLYASPPPPSYETAIMDDMRMSDFSMPTSPLYPSRFRYDPYSKSGIRVESDTETLSVK